MPGVQNRKLKISFLNHEFAVLSAKQSSLPPGSEDVEFLREYTEKVSPRCGSSIERGNCNDYAEK
jgi:hypothetical protein